MSLYTDNLSVEVGQQVLLTATVCGDAPGTPTGQVQFLAGQTVLGTATLDANGQATLTVSYQSVGSFAIAASYSGDATFQAQTSLPATLAVSAMEAASGPNDGNSGATGPSGPMVTDEPPENVQGASPVLMSFDLPPPDAPPSSSTGPTGPTLTASSTVLGKVLGTWIDAKLSPLLAVLAPVGTVKITITNFSFNSSDLLVVPVSANQPSNANADALSLITTLNFGAAATTTISLNLPGAPAGAPQISSTVEGQVTLPVVVPLGSTGNGPQDLIFTTCTFHYEIAVSLHTSVPQALANPAAAIWQAISAGGPAQP